MTPIEDGNLSSIENTWYLPRNSPKKIQKMAKTDKSCKISKKNVDFMQQNLPTGIGQISSRAIFFSHPSSFWTPEFWSGTLNEDFKRWSLCNRKWSFLIIYLPKVIIKSPVRFSTTPLASLAGLNKYTRHECLLH